MKRTTYCVVVAVTVSCSMGLAMIGMAQVIPAPASFTASSEFGDPFIAAALFDGTVTDSDIGTTVYGTAGDNQWAGVGPGPHQLYIDFGSTISASGLAYAQRQGDAVGNNDKVGQIELWFSDSDFGGSLPITPPDAVVSPTVPAPDTGLLLNYSLGGLHSGRYVAANFLALDTTLDPAVNNIGGSELRLTVPEPSSVIVMLTSAVLALYRVGTARRMCREASIHVRPLFTGQAGQLAGGLGPSRLGPGRD